MAHLDTHPTILPPDPESYARQARFASDRQCAGQDLRVASALAVGALAAFAHGVWRLLAAPMVLLASILFTLHGRGGSVVRGRDGGSRTAPSPVDGVDARSQPTCLEEQVTGAPTEVDVLRLDQRPTMRSARGL